MKIKPNNAGFLLFKLQVMICFAGRKEQFYKIIPHFLDELFVQEEK